MTHHRMKFKMMTGHNYSFYFTYDCMITSNPACVPAVISGTYHLSYMESNGGGGGWPEISG